jgi:hypothetical protein
MIDDLWTWLRSVIFMIVFIIDPPGGGKILVTALQLKERAILPNNGYRINHAQT